MDATDPCGTCRGTVPLNIGPELERWRVVKAVLVRAEGISKDRLAPGDRLPVMVPSCSGEKDMAL